MNSQTELRLPLRDSIGRFGRAAWDLAHGQSSADSHDAVGGLNGDLVVKLGVTTWRRCFERGHACFVVTNKYI